MATPQKPQKPLPYLKMEPDEATLLEVRGYVIGRILGYGGFATVYKATHYGRPVAVKALDMLHSNAQMVTQEIFLLKRIDHPNVVKILDLSFVKSSARLLIFMEFMGGGELAEFISDYSKVKTEAILAKLFGQMAAALLYMHRRGYAHRDLKPANILLDGSKTIAKIADFGLATIAYDSETGAPTMSDSWAGTLSHFSPEIVYTMVFEARVEALKKKKQPIPVGWTWPVYCPFKGDVWSMGVILYEMLHDGVEPYEHKHKVDWLDQAEWFYGKLKNKVVFKKETISRSGKALVERLLTWEEKNRPEMEAILKDEWITCSDEARIETPKKRASLKKKLNQPISYMKHKCSIS